MITHSMILIALCGLALSSLALHGQQSGTKPNVLKGPATAKMEGIARVEVPAGYQFLDGKTTRAVMKASGQPISGRESGLLMPTNEHWSVIFEFNDVGFVKDDEKDKLDADKLLASIREGTARANKERERLGSPPLEIVGWEQPPRYDSVTHNLEWAVRATSAGRPILNYNTRLLGRKGVMEAVLIVEPDKLPETLPTFKRLLAGYSFQSGQNYAEYRSGDKIAKYGLAALIVGGGAVGAAKLGMFAWLAVALKKAWKLIVVAVVGVVSFSKRLIFGRGRTRPPE
jgi:uncharacterized membrane-anchored protein